jgi:hypothetical protein
MRSQRWVWLLSPTRESDFGRSSGIGSPVTS